MSIGLYRRRNLPPQLIFGTSYIYGEILPAKMIMSIQNGQCTMNWFIIYVIYVIQVAKAVSMCVNIKGNKMYLNMANLHSEIKVGARPTSRKLKRNKSVNDSESDNKLVGDSYILELATAKQGNYRYNYQEEKKGVIYRLNSVRLVKGVRLVKYVRPAILCAKKMWKGDSLHNSELRGGGYTCVLIIAIEVDSHVRNKGDLYNIYCILLVTRQVSSAKNIRIVDSSHNA